MRRKADAQVRYMPPDEIDARQHEILQMLQRSVEELRQMAHDYNLPFDQMLLAEEFEQLDFLAGR